MSSRIIPHPQPLCFVPPVSEAAARRSARSQSVPRLRIPTFLQPHVVRAGSPDQHLAKVRKAVRACCSISRAAICCLVLHTNLVNGLCCYERLLTFKCCS
jgi:hypothetical protein